MSPETWKSWPMFRMNKTTRLLNFFLAGCDSTPHWPILVVINTKTKHTSNQSVQAQEQKPDMGFADLITDAGLTGQLCSSMCSRTC